MPRREIYDHEVTGEPILLRVIAMDAPQDTGTSHQYRIERNDGSQVGCINFHREIAEEYGPDGIPDKNGIDANGVSPEALLCVVIDHLSGLQNGPFKCKEYDSAMKRAFDALFILTTRTKKLLEKRAKELVTA